MIELLLIVCASAVLIYSYALYPLLVRLLAGAMGHAWARDPDATPTVSVVLSVYNEESVIEQCLNSLLALDYPKERLEILIGSDGASDSTSRIVAGYAQRYPSIHFFPFSERRGKIQVLNDLVAAATGDILFFIDADVVLDTMALRKQVQNYADPEVGGVAGNFVLMGNADVRFEPLRSEQYYMSVENRLRLGEARLHSTVGLFGAHYSIRRSLWVGVPNEAVHDELYVCLSVIRAGKRMVFEGEAVARESFGRSMSDEFKRKTRFASRGFSTLAQFPELLNPFRGWPGIMLWSHKILRWLSPFALIVIILATVVGAVAGEGSPLFTDLLYVEAVGGAIVLLSAALRPLTSKVPILAHAYWFVTMNAAFALGAFRFLFGREQKYWDQTARAKMSPAAVAPANSTTSVTTTAAAPKKNEEAVHA